MKTSKNQTLSQSSLKQTSDVITVIHRARQYHYTPVAFARGWSTLFLYRVPMLAPPRTQYPRISFAVILLLRLCAHRWLKFVPGHPGVLFFVAPSFTKKSISVRGMPWQRMTAIYSQPSISNLRWKGRQYNGTANTTIYSAFSGHAAHHMLSHRLWDLFSRPIALL